MSFIPATAESDYLKHIIFLPKFYYKSKFLQRCADFCLFFAIAYVIFVIYNAIFNRNDVIEQDVLVAGIIFEVKVLRLQLNLQFSNFYR